MTGEPTNEDVMLALLTAHWNLIGTLAEEALRAGVPSPSIQLALLRLIEKNDKIAPPECGELVNQGIDGILQALRETGR